MVERRGESRRTVAGARWLPCGRLARAAILFAVAALLGGAVARAQETPAAPDEAELSPEPDPRVLAAFAPEQARVSGRIGWVSADRANLLGQIRADVPWRVRARREAFFAIDTTLPIRRAESDWTFQVLELDYRLDAGVRLPFRDGSRWVAYIGQVGKEQVDREGSTSVRYLAAGLESAGWRRHVGLRPFEWRLHGGWLFLHKGIDARALVRADARWGLPAGRRRPMIGLDLEVDALLGGSTGGTDLRVGPWIDLGWLGWRGTREAELFVHWARLHNPAGPGFDGIVAGLHLARTGGRAAFMPASLYHEPTDIVPAYDDPGVHGHVEMGRGWGRRAARFRTFFSSPPLLGSARLLIDVDANVLDGPDPTELYYLVSGGLHVPCATWSCGVILFHRSNHRLGDAGDRVTSNNVLQLGIETRGWGRPLELTGEDMGERFEARLRVGYVLQTDFREDRRWNVQAGIRWDVPNTKPALIPFLLAELQAGDAKVYSLGAGVRTGEGLELRLERRRDDQLFGDHYASLLLLGGRF